MEVWMGDGNGGDGDGNGNGGNGNGGDISQEPIKKPVFLS